MNDLHGQTDMTEPAKLPPSFEVFFGQHQKEFLKRAHLTLRDRRDAEEAVITAAKKMHDKWDRILAHENPMALVFKILSGTVKDFYRKTSRDMKRERLLNERVPRPTGDDLYALRSNERLDRALARLEAGAPLQAACVRLRHLEGLAPAEIAERLDISYGSAKANVSLGLTALRALMNGNGD